MHWVMPGEYAGVLRGGKRVQRNEANAIIVHGTMRPIRRPAMERGGRALSATTSARGGKKLDVMRHGWLTTYEGIVASAGVLPEAFKKQASSLFVGGSRSSALAPFHAARARHETAPVLLDDLEAAIGPAMALLLEGLIGVRQQAVAVAVVGVMREPAMLA